MKFHIDYNLLFNKEIIEYLYKEIKCKICCKFLIDPKMCLNCQNNFCTVCIESFCNVNKNKICYFGCENIKFIKNEILNKILLKICKFYCEFCNEIISYYEIENHIIKCKNFENFKKKQKYKKLLNEFNNNFYINRKLSETIEYKQMEISELNEEYQNYFQNYFKLKELKEKYEQIKYDYIFFIKFNTNPITKEELNDEDNFHYKIKRNKKKNKFNKNNLKNYYNNKLTVNEYYDNKIIKLKESYKNKSLNEKISICSDNLIHFYK